MAWWQGTAGQVEGSGDPPGCGCQFRGAVIARCPGDVLLKELSGGLLSRALQWWGCRVPPRSSQARHPESVFKNLQISL